MFKHFAWFVETIFKFINYIEKRKCPILFIRGNADKTIPCHHLEELWLRAKKINSNTHLDLRPRREYNDLNLKDNIKDFLIDFCSKRKLLDFEKDKNFINNIVQSWMNIYIKFL